MLILSRKVGEAVVLDDKITVRIVDISKGAIRLGIDAPSDVLILREELAQEIKNANIEAIKKQPAQTDMGLLSSLRAKIGGKKESQGTTKETKKVEK